MVRSLVVALLTALTAFSTFAAEKRTYVVGVKPHRSHHALAARVLTADVVALESRAFDDYANVGSFSLQLSDEEAAQMSRQPEVEYVEAARPIYAIGASAPHSGFVATPLDAGGQSIPWGIAAVRATDLWNATRGYGVNVAVVDTGIDYNHPDLKQAYAGGYDTFTKSSDPMDDNGHGTHVAGTIAAQDNGTGVVGVAPDARIWAVRVLRGEKGTGDTSTIVAGLNWVIKQKCGDVPVDKCGSLGGKWIVNMSLGECATPQLGCSTSPPLSMADACQKAADAGILMVAAAGNLTQEAVDAGLKVEPVTFPAALSTVLAVGATDALHLIADFSNQGPEVDLVAPGTMIKSSWLLGKGADSRMSSTAGTFDTIAMVGSPNGFVSGQIVYCGLGKSASDFPQAVNGNIALIKRGDIPFADKTKNAIAAGAKAVAIFNNEAGPFAGTLSDLTYVWPLTVSLSAEDGQKLVGCNCSGTITNSAGDFRYEQGTSMASPHVAGVAALVWAAAPAATATEVWLAMTLTAHDLGPVGSDSAYGNGYADAYEATRKVAPQLPIFGNGNIGGRRILRRGRP